MQQEDETIEIKERGLHKEESESPKPISIQVINNQLYFPIQK